MDTEIDLLVNGSPMAAFAIFLIYLHTTMQKRMDALVEKFQEQLDSMRGENRVEVEDMRQRYDQVIEKYNMERTELRSQLFTEMGEVNRKVDMVTLTQEGTVSMIEDLGDRVKALKGVCAKLQDSVDKSCDTLKEMQQEAKLRELADKAIAARK